jgi:hypothetical protein
LASIARATKGGVNLVGNIVRGIAQCVYSVGNAIGEVVEEICKGMKPRVEKAPGTMTMER